MRCMTRRFALSLLVLLGLAAGAVEPLAEWSFDEGTGDSAVDRIGGLAGKVTGQWATGPFGKGVFFSEEKFETIQIPDSPAIQFGRKSFTIAAWICPTKLALEPKGQYRRLLCKSAYPGTFWTVDIFDAGRVMFGMKDSEGHGGNTVSTGTIKENEWTYLTIVVDREAFATSYYFNGELDSKQPFPEGLTGALDVPGTALLVSTWRKYVGLIDTLTFSRGASTPAEITAAWQAGRDTHKDTTFTSIPRPKPSFVLPVPTGDRQTMWDFEALAKAPKTYPAPGFADQEGNGVRALFYDGLLLKGKPTRVFAWYGVPKERAGKLPAMLLVHGGGGTAFKSWVETWNTRGYAALAMDTSGGIPKHPEGAKRGWQGHEFSGPRGWGDFGNVSAPPHDQWTYHAVAAAVLGHSLLRSMPEVDATRVGLTGISWGGYLTNIIAGVDDRFRFASPVYGCGFLGENSGWSGTFGGMGANGVKWLRLWDPSQYVVYAEMPMLFCNGTNDHFYPMDSWQKTYRSAKGTRTLACKVRMIHSHPPHGDPPEITDFANHILRDGPALPQVTGQGQDGRTAWATYEGEIAKAELCYTTAVGNWEKRRWEQLPAEIAKGKASAALPEGTTVCFLNLIDARGHLVSTEHWDLTIKK